MSEPHLFDWETHQKKIKIPRQALTANGGPHPEKECFNTADYKGS